MPSLLSAVTMPSQSKPETPSEAGKRAKLPKCYRDVPTPDFSVLSLTDTTVETAQFPALRCDGHTVHGQYNGQALKLNKEEKSLVDEYERRMTAKALALIDKLRMEKEANVATYASNLVKERLSKDRANILEKYPTFKADEEDLRYMICQSCDEKGDKGHGKIKYLMNTGPGGILTRIWWHKKMEGNKGDLLMNKNEKISKTLPNEKKTSKSDDNTNKNEKVEEGTRRSEEDVKPDAESAQKPAPMCVLL